MPRQVLLRGAGGRWIRADAPEEEVLQVLIRDTTSNEVTSYAPEEYFRPTADVGPTRLPWTVDEQDRTIIWKDFDQRHPPDFSGIQAPEGVSQMRVYFNNNPEGGSPSGVIGTTWMDANDLQTITVDMMAKGNPTGFYSIVFERD